MNCVSCQDLLFDFVYGLLDESEAMLVREHVASCAACMAELTKAKADQHKLGQAALAIAQVAPFQMPSERPVVETTPAPTPVAEQPKRRVRSVTIVAWVGTLACCALAAVVVAFNHRAQMSQQEAVVASLLRENQAIDAKLAALDNQRELPQSLNKAARQIHLSGPGQVTPGASAGMKVAIRDLDGVPRAGNVDVNYVNARNESVAKQSLDVDGVAEIPVPAELGKNHGPVRVQVVAKSGGENVGAIEETVQSQASGLSAHVAVNKLFFKPGERVQVRTLALDRVTLTPAPTGTKLGVSLLAENGQAVAPALELTTLAGMAAGQIQLPANLAEGVYVLETRGANLAPVHRRIEVLPPVAPSADVITQNNRFRAGEPITQDVRLYLSNGAPARNVPVFGNTNVAEPAPRNDRNNAAQNVQAPYNFQGNTDDAGRLQIKSPPLTNVQTGRQLWQADLSYGANKKEKALVQRELQVQPSRVVVDFFPEGGRLIAGTSNRVFYRVRAPEDGAAAEARIAVGSSEGRIFDSGKETSFGSFLITPDPKETFVLKVLSPRQDDVKQPFANLGILTDGLLLRGDAVQDGGKPLDLVLENRGPERLVQVIASCRGQIVFHDRVAVGAGRTPLAIASPVDGLVRVTALEAKDGQLVPLTERLFFRTPSRRLELTVDAKTYAKAGPIQLDVTARDERQQPAACWSLASIVDDRFRGDVPEPTLAAHFLLLGDAPADLDLSELPLIALDGQSNRAELELVLGIFGWRRVGVPAANPTMLAKAEAQGKDGASEREVAKADKDRKGDAKAKASSSTFFYRVEPTGLELQRQLEELRQKLQRENEFAQIALLKDRADLGQRLSNARADLEALARRPLERLMDGLGVLTLALLVVAVLAMAYGLTRLVRRRSAAMSFGISCGCLAVCLALLVGRPHPESADIRGPAVAAKADKAIKREPRVAVLNEKVPALPPSNGKFELNAVNELKEAGDKPRQAREPAADIAADRAGKAEKADRQADGRRFNNEGVVPGEQIAQLEQNKQAVLRDFKNAEARGGQAQIEPVANPSAVALVRQQPGSAPLVTKMIAPTKVPPVTVPAAPGGGGLGGFPPKAPAGAPAAGAPADPAMAQPAAPIADAGPKKEAVANLMEKMKSAPKGAALKDGLPRAGAPRDAAAEMRRAQEPALEALAKRHAADTKDQRLDLGALNRQFGARRSQDIDDPATILWNPALLVPAGGASLGVELPVGRYRVLFFGHTEDGRLGVYDGVLSAK